MNDGTEHPSRTGEDEFLRLPGLFRRWELPEVIEAGLDYRFEEAGTTDDGTLLLAIYVRERAP